MRRLVLDAGPIIALLSAAIGDKLRQNPICQAWVN
jgi:hypothetical protein